MLLLQIRLVVQEESGHCDGAFENFYIDRCERVVQFGIGLSPSIGKDDTTWPCLGFGRGNLGFAIRSGLITSV
jgi:hypothetical protein